VTAPAGKQPKKGGILRAGVNQDALSLDPHKHKNIVETYFKSMVYSSLLKFKENFEPELDLAERYQEVDSITYVFYLRKGVKFHNGDELTAEDVKASHERLLDPANAAMSYVYLKNIDKITVKDPYTVEFKLKNPQATFIAAMALPSNYIAQKKLIEKPGVNFETEVVGTGPFKFASRTVGVETRVERNPNYFLSGYPYLDEVRMRPIADDPARMNALRAGDVDLVTFVPWADQGALETDPKFTLATLKEGGYVHIEFMVAQPPMDNVKLRQAINYAIDREAIVKTAASGRGKPCYGSPIASWSWAYNREVENTYKYNPEKAKQLIQEAGAQGLKLELVTWPVDTELFGRPSVVVANNLKAVGLDVTLKPVALAEWSDIHAKSTYQMEMYGSTYNFPDPDFISNFYGSGGANSSSTKFADKEMEEWLIQARAITDRVKRKELYDKVVKKGLELAPYAILFYREQGEALYKYVQGYDQIMSASFNSMMKVWIDK
jgi:ABC-type transport system substrate-binding protein